MPDAEADRTGPPTRLTAVEPVHRYRIVARDPAAHLFEVRVTVAQPDPEGQRFAFPAWTPGSYMIRDYARNVVAVRAESDGIGVALEKIDKSTWRAAAVGQSLTLIADIFAHDLSVRGAHLDTTHAYFNGPCVFPRVVGQESAACEVDVVAPSLPAAAEWRVATSMRAHGASDYGFGTYLADDYDELIDHPFEIGTLKIGEFEASGIPHVIAIRGRTRCDMARLCRDLQTLCEAQHALLGCPADLDRYVFLLYAPADGYGGLEHRWSSSLVCKRDNLPRRRQSQVEEGYRSFLGLASHEYFHLWNVKRIRPLAVATSDLAEEAYTRLLWVFEGITSYYDDLMLRRAGLIDDQSYFELLGRTMTRVQRGAGRKRQSVAESSFDAWIKFYKPDANAGNAIVSYYAKGSLIALSLDLKLRSETEGRVSLDDVMRASWARYGETGDGMPEDGFERLCDEVSGLDLGDFFDAAVRGTGELPLETLLATHGIALSTRARSGGADKGGVPSEGEKELPVSIGALLVEKDGAAVFTSVDNGGAAERAGIAPGDQAVALDGVRLTASNLDERLRVCRAGDRMSISVFRGDELMTFDIELADAPADTIYLAIDDDAAKDARARRDAWLSG